jgi:uncharacterized membrane protein (DUF106 family)
MLATTHTASTDSSTRRWLILGAAAALIALALEETFKPTSAVGPVLFAIFILGVLTVVVLSIVMIVQRRRIDQD